MKTCIIQPAYCLDFSRSDEFFANIARYNPEVIIACAYQRSDSHEALEILAKFLAYNTNAYVLRSSVSLGADSPVGGQRQHHRLHPRCHPRPRLQRHGQGLGVHLRGAFAV